MYYFATIFLFFTILLSDISAQEQLPFYELRKPSLQTSEGSILARFIEGLGFRFYWSTDSLREEDLAYRPTEQSRSTLETMEHIYQLSLRIRMAATLSENDATPTTYDELRTQTLNNLYVSVEAIRKLDDISHLYIPMSDGKKMSIYYLMNGPINDATWHCGQIASYRRISGNPISPHISQFTGTVK